MRRELSDDIIRSCPTIFRNHENNPYGIRFGIECGDGWYRILKDAFVRIERIVLSMPVPEHENFVVDQVKSKFASLRIYMRSSNIDIDKIIEAAEKECANACEHCGKPGKRRGGAWITLLCDSCHAAWGARRKEMWKE